MNRTTQKPRLRYMLRRLGSEARGYRRFAAAVAVAGIMSTGLSLLFVWVTKHIVDIATGRDSGSWSLAVTIMLAALAGRLLFGFLSGRLGVVCSTRLSNSLRSRVFSHLMRSSWKGRETFHSGDAVNRLTGDVTTISSMVASVLPGMAVDMVKLIAAFAFLVWIDARMALAIVVIMPLAMAVSKVYVKRTHAITRQIRSEESIMQRIMQESLQHRVLITTLGATENASARFAGSQNRFFDLIMSRNDITLLSRTAVTAGFMAGYAVAFLWCARGLMAGDVTFGVMTAFLQLVAMVQRPVVDLAGKIPSFVNTSVAIERVDEILAQPVEEKGPTVNLDGPIGMSLRDISFTYVDGEAPVISHFTYDFRPGTITAIAGPTGTGKTTLLMLLIGLLKPDSGHITMYTPGDKAVDLSTRTKGNIVFVPQGNSLISGTIRENLQLAAPGASTAAMETALRLAAADFVMQLPDGLDTPCGERGSGLSEGQAQRIAIARALLHPAGVVVLDEPSSALDRDTEARLMSRLRSVAERRTIVIVTHSRRLMEMCDNTILVNQS